jgi:hypothetical protein
LLGTDAKVGSDLVLAGLVLAGLVLAGLVLASGLQGRCEQAVSRS